MDWPDMTVLDVGHGNCALVVDGEMAFVVDTPRGNRVLNLALAEKGVSQLDAILISHGDADHVGGLLSVLSNSSVSVDRIYLNPEMERDTKIWRDLRTVVRDARKRGKVDVKTALTCAYEDELQLPNLQVTVLAPTPENAMTGAGGETLDGDDLTANAMSAAIRFKDDNSRGVLLTGDLDAVGLAECAEAGRSLEADVLVFPHHGGLPGRASPEAFACDLTTKVGPKTVLFSMSRSRGTLPDREIIAGIRAAGSEPHIACTQLSSHCAKALPDVEQPYLSTLPSTGRASGHCCAGTVEIYFTDDGIYSPQLGGHAKFVGELPAAICREALPNDEVRVAQPG